MLSDIIDEEMNCGDNNLEYLSEYIDLNNKKEVNKKEMVNNIIVYILIYINRINLKMK